MTEAQTLTLGTERQRLDSRRRRQLAAFIKAADSGQHRRLAALADRLRQTTEFLATLDELAAGTGPAGPERRYRISSLFLHDSFKRLTAQKEEEFFFITGTEVGGVLVLDQVAAFPHERRSIVGVTGDVRSTHGLLIKLEEFGHRLLASFHSHPGEGSAATIPSGIDRGFQERLERAGHVTVMAIFSRDGFVRFVRLDGDIDIEIFGTGVERYEGNIFKLTNLD